MKFFEKNKIVEMSITELVDINGGSQLSNAVCYALGYFWGMMGTDTTNGQWLA